MAENGERDLGETLPACEARVLHTREALTLLLRYTKRILSKKKNDCFAVYVHVWMKIRYIAKTFC